MSTSPAMASSSSSADSSESWQPSQEANFHTATLGLPMRSSITATSSQLPHIEQPGHLGPGEHRAVTAQEHRSELAVAAGADTAAHVALEGHVHPLGRDPAGQQRLGGVP